MLKRSTRIKNIHHFEIKFNEFKKHSFFQLYSPNLCTNVIEI